MPEVIGWVLAIFAGSGLIAGFVSWANPERDWDHVDSRVFTGFLVSFLVGVGLILGSNWGAIVRDL